MNPRSIIGLYLLGAACIPPCTFAQTPPTGKVHTDKNLFYRQSVEPRQADNHLYTIYFSNANNIYNLKGFKVARAGGDIIDLKVNPAGHSAAVLTDRKGKRKVEVYSLSEENRRLAEIPGLGSPAAIAYTSDSRLLAVADGNTVRFFDSRDFSPKGTRTISIIPSRLVNSPLTGHIAALSGNVAEIVSAETEASVRTIAVPEGIRDAAFSPAGDRLAILTSAGRVACYDARTFAPLEDIAVSPDAESIAFHPDGKYLATGKSDGAVAVYNLTDPTDTAELTDPSDPMTTPRFLRDGKGTTYIAYTSPKAVKYRRITGFSQNYTKMLEDELNARMLEWSKMRPMETEAEYALRVNDETKERQKRLFANEIATSLAGDLISHADVTLGAYNPESGLLSLTVAGLPTVYLNVDQSEATAFGNPADLQFSNVVYGLTPNDTFEIIYAEVFNPSTGKTYVFDNLERQNLDFLATDDSFISLNLLTQNSRQDAVLQDIKDQVIDEARRNSAISEHTNINVRADIVPDYDAAGRRVNNYRIDFTYTVDPGFSTSEDFAPGKYRISESHAAESMLEIVRKAIGGEFAQYVVPGKRLTVNITGTADALPINGAIAYDGAFGEIADEPCRVDGELKAISVQRGAGIRTNEQLAFMRAKAVSENLRTGLPDLGAMETLYNYSINLSDEKGGAHRRINVSFIFSDAF